MRGTLEMKSRYLNFAKIKNWRVQSIITASFLSLGLLLNSVGTEAQLRPWDYSNEILVDLSVIGDAGLGPAPRAPGAIALPSLTGEILDPPLRTPRSRLLVTRPPSRGALFVPEQLPVVKLISPAELKRRDAARKKAVAKRKSQKPRAKTRAKLRKVAKACAEVTS